MSSGGNYKTLAMLPLFEYQVFGPIEAKYNSMANCRCVGDKLGFDRRRLHFETRQGYRVIHVLTITSSPLTD